MSPKQITIIQLTPRASQTPAATTPKVPPRRTSEPVLRKDKKPSGSAFKQILKSAFTADWDEKRLKEQEAKKGRKPITIFGI